jgi:hypothetical protein
MVGTYTYDTNGVFVILKNTFFQNAFSGMLEWENNMRNDLLPLIKASYPEETAVSTNGDRFEDLVVSNIDVRAIKNSTGKVILAYAFADTNTIIIATSTDTLKYLLDKLLVVKTVQ